jgi:hypothetical protein
MKVLNRTVRTLLLQGVEECGSYEPEEVLTYIEDSLCNLELVEIVGFLTWCSVNKETFGYGNIDQQFARYKESEARS